MVSRQKLTVWATIMVILFLAAVVAFAADNATSNTSTPPSPDPTTAPSTAPTPAPSTAPTPAPTTAPSTSPAPTSSAVTATTRDNTLAIAISKAYAITVTGQDIAGLRMNSHLGYGEIGLLYDLANASGKTTEDILAMRENMGWGKIAITLGLKVPEVMKKNSAVLKTAKMDDADQDLQEKLNQEHNEKTGKTNGGNSSKNENGSNGNSNNSNNNSNSHSKK